MNFKNVNPQNESNILLLQEVDNQVTQIPECDIIIDERTIMLLKQMFCDRDAYVNHANVMRTFLMLLQERLLCMDTNSYEYKNQFPLFDTLNNLYGSIVTLDKEKLLNLKRV